MLKRPPVSDACFKSCYGVGQLLLRCDAGGFDCVEQFVFLDEKLLRNYYEHTKNYYPISCPTMSNYGKEAGKVQYYQALPGLPFGKL